ncbi:serine/threonine protein kinase [Thioflexithrix psekupsensis]|uniref:Protein kinase domain-containing protein n=1 Tax=Thioflexithrix psekupsensis TaxID=1570016 RepID=A0A251X925_9GAMM|nr:serine/threonine-protein kinase [Thioflexithrix psekupsensis]OUD14173.1 hypothetical protein TPSD3_07525 [Thioflexithrix psekupsensis]
MSSYDNSSSSTLDPLLLAQLPDRYRIHHLLGSSAYSLVYRASEYESHTAVIIKCFAPSIRGAYLREMAAAFGISHPGITRCIDTFHLTDGRACMVYEYVKAGTLRDYLRQHVKLELNIVISCLRQLLQALDYLHHLQLIHCDIKPENVLLDQTEEIEKTRFILSDLGAACPLREAHEGQHTVGSPAYCAPERLYEKFSFNSDLYSLGVMGFELVMGQRPFEGSATELARAHLKQVPDLSGIEYAPLRDFLAQLLQKDPRLRPSNAQVALHLLSRIERGYAVDGSWQPSAATKTLPIRLDKVVPVDFNVPEQWRLRLHLPLTQRPQRLLSLHLEQHPVIGVVYGTHIEFAQPQASRTGLQVLLNASAPLQNVGTDQLLYVQGNRLLHLDLSTQVRTCLWEDCDALLAFHLRGEYLIWCNQRSGHICHLPSGEQHVYRVQSYAFAPQVRLWRDGWLLTSGGRINQLAQLRDLHGHVQAEWTLDGPIVEWCELGDVMLAMTLTVTGREPSYALWRLSLESDPRKQLLNEPILNYGSTAQGLFWLTQDQQLYQCGVDLHARCIGKLPRPASLLHISADQRYLAAASLTENAMLLDLWENEPKSY